MVLALSRIRSSRQSNKLGKEPEPESQAGRDGYQPTADREAQQAGQHLGRLNESIGAFIEQHHAHYEENKGGDARRFIWTKAATFGSCLAAGFALLAFAAAAAQALIARDTEQTQLRAYVGTPAGNYKLMCQGCTARPDGAANGTYEILISVKNFGSTPALKPVTCARPIAVEHSGPVTFIDVAIMRRMCAEPINNRNQTTIWPGDTVVSEIPFGPDEVITRTRRGLSRTFVLGYTTYADTFGSHHMSWYCNEYKRYTNQDVFTGCDRTNLPEDD